MIEPYEIIVTSDANDDLAALRDYIAVTLAARETARSYILAIRKEIASLAVMPERVKLVDTEPWRTRGFRRVLVRNFFVYYRIDETEKRVYILNVIYARRNQLNALRQRDID